MSTQALSLRNTVYTGERSGAPTTLKPIYTAVLLRILLVLSLLERT